MNHAGFTCKKKEKYFFPKRPERDKTLSKCSTFALSPGHFGYLILNS
jgi:hypothetical protein